MVDGRISNLNLKSDMHIFKKTGKTLSISGSQLQCRKCHQR